VRARDNAEWLAALRASGPGQAAALADLRAYVLRAALYALRRAGGTLGLTSPAEVATLAEDCAQDAVLAILDNLDRFRGDSRFTTWAYAFAVNAALVAARRERGKRVPLDRLLEEADTGWPAPDEQAVQDETVAAVRAAIAECLSERQRQALKAVVFDGVPLDELARHWSTNRNALYKLLHDARRKLKAHLHVRFAEPAQPTTRREP
jgi:RNA polymerase sigma-70 factor, ECF subfamily